MVFFLPPKYPPVSRDFFLDMMKCPLTARPPDPITIRKGNRGGGGGRDDEGGGLANPSLHTTPAPPFPPSLSFPAASHPSPSAPKSWTTAKEIEKKFSSPDPGGRSASLLFAANPQSPDVTRSRSQSAVVVGGGSLLPSAWASRGAGGDRPI